MRDDVITIDGRESPSSRRAWIEITYCSFSPSTTKGVALLAEGVDRNDLVMDAEAAAGESPSSRRAWIEITSM